MIILSPEKRVTLGMSPNNFEKQEKGDFYEVVCETCRKSFPINEMWKNRNYWLLLTSHNRTNNIATAEEKAHRHRLVGRYAKHEIVITKSNHHLVAMLAYEHDHPVALPRQRHP